MRNSESRGPGCPDPLVWYEIASGQLSPDSTGPFLQHVADCDFCGPLLKAAVADLMDETSPAEKKQISAIASAQPDWQRRLARRIAGSENAGARPATAWSKWKIPQLALFAASLLLLALVAQHFQKQLAQTLLARAYSEARPLEMRMAGAKYAKFTAERGAKGSLLDRPSSLILAEALISTHLGSHDPDPGWLQAKARADLLDGRYEAARDSLARALQLSPKSPEILIDLATAHFQQGNYDAAFEALSQALKLKPDDPVALFNRIIVGQQLHLYRQALEDAQRYLQIEPGSDWANEAAERASDLRTKLKKHDESHARPLLSPEQLAASVNDPNLRPTVDERIEEYLYEGVGVWLARAYPVKPASSDPVARQALFFLADLTLQQHNDHWLSDILRASSAADFPLAVAALSRAVQANYAGQYDIATEQSAQARQMFQSSGNRAGALRAQFELAFAAQLKRDSEVCRQQAAAALAESEKYSYPWLQVQLGLEKGVCSFLTGNIGADEKTAGRALDLAQKSSYGSLYLRALFFTAEDAFATGDSRTALNLANAGLVHYWASLLPVRRGFSLYTEMTFVAEAAKQPNLQAASWREASALIDADPDLLQRAMTHELFANAATTAGNFQVAGQQYAEASRLFALVPQSGASRTDAIENSIRSAQLDIGMGHFDAALTRLTAIQDEVRPPSNSYLALGRMFYSALGELQLRMNHDAEAERALRPALALAEQNLQSLSSESERTTWRKDEAPVYLALAEAQLKQGRSQDALEMYEWYLGASQRVGTKHVSNTTRMNPPVPVPSALAPGLPLLSRETVITFGLLPDGLAIWVYDDRGVHFKWIPQSTQDLQEMAARFSSLSSDPKSELIALRRDARSLYQSLIVPVEGRLDPGRTLVIQADGPLALLSFESLIDADGLYLIERWPIVHSMGQASDFSLHEAGPISADLPALVVGSTASSPADGLVPLPDVASEADTVARGFRSALVLKGDEATFGAVARQLPTAAVFHFAGHSLTTVDRSGLMLLSGNAASPQVLDGNVLQGLNLQSLKLAVLSACSTASGVGGSKGFNSITEALLRARVPHVVASRWAVDSTEARAFVEDFYRNALSGQSVADSMRLTSRKMLANPKTSHPYYWSAFAAYGRP